MQLWTSCALDVVNKKCLLCKSSSFSTTFLTYSCNQLYQNMSNNDSSDEAKKSPDEEKKWVSHSLKFSSFLICNTRGRALHQFWAILSTTKRWKWESQVKVAKMLQIDPTRVKEDVEDRLRTEEESVNWLRDKMKQSMELTTTMTGRSIFWHFSQIFSHIKSIFRRFNFIWRTIDKVGSNYFTSVPRNRKLAKTSREHWPYFRCFRSCHWFLQCVQRRWSSGQIRTFFGQ